MNSGEAKVEADVKAFGWHVVLVAPSNETPRVAYTVGLFHTFQHPEVVVLGLPDTVGSHRQFKHPSKPGRVTVSGGLDDDMPNGTLASVTRQAHLQRTRP